MVIEVLKGNAAIETSDESRPNFISAPVAKSSKVHRTVCKVPVGSTTIMLIEGDITEYRCDMVVNSANGQLDHIGGVAKAIVDKGTKHILLVLNWLSKHGHYSTPYTW